MGYIPIFAWTFFFIFFTFILGYNSLRQARLRKKQALNDLNNNVFAAGYKSLPAVFQEPFNALKGGNWLNGVILLRLAELTNEHNFDDADWLTLMKTIKDYQNADKNFAHLLKYQPTKSIAGILRWA